MKAGNPNHYRTKPPAGPLAGRRVCLACGRTFLSEGPWNRICIACHKQRALEDAQAAIRVVGVPPALLAEATAETVVEEW